MSSQPFSHLKLNNLLLENLKSLHYKQMTAIQAKSLPEILRGKDLIAQAKTGSGKTAAFGLGILQGLKVKHFRVQSLVLCPTRELADQVAQEIRRLGRTIHNIKVLTLCGGMPFGPQIGSLEHGAHIVVGTPGRVEEHVSKGTLELSHLTSLVLDEADRMLDMGFKETLDTIIDFAPEKRQTLLFSATFPEEISHIAQRVMRSPVHIEVDTEHTEDSIEQLFFNIDKIDVNGLDKDRQQCAVEVKRLISIELLLQHYKPNSSIIFCNTKRETQALNKELNQRGFSSVALHGDLEQKERDQTLVRFSNKSALVLIATDVAARGLDIDNLDMVINYSLARENDVHVHRIGRTGRADNHGLACSLFSEKERYKFEQLEQHLSQTFKIDTLPPLSLLKQLPDKTTMTTLQIDGGKKQKVRAGDVLGALTAENRIEGKQVGKIQLAENWAFVAVERKVAKKALQKLTAGKLKERTFRARAI